MARIAPLAEGMLRAIDEQQFAEAEILSAKAESMVAAAKLQATEPTEAFLNDLFLVGVYIRLLASYSDVWEHILQLRFAASWCSLQDALDRVRTIKSLSEMDVAFFEAQLTNLEHAYPYKIFFSIGAVAARIECSICGKDIDSPECVHRRGQLYAGEMACGLIRDFTRFDHVSMVSNPDDKRCVVEIADTSEQFKLARHISTLIGDRRLLISEFDRIIFSKRRVPNPAYRKVGRNDPCFCGSGKKFKTCCIENKYAEGDHADVCAKRRPRVGDVAKDIAFATR